MKLNSNNSQPIKIILMVFAILGAGWWGLIVLKYLEKIVSNLSQCMV
mgnify:CR=1 FL=1